MKLNLEKTTDFNTFWSLLVWIDTDISSRLWQKTVLSHDKKKKKKSKFVQDFKLCVFVGVQTFWFGFLEFFGFCFLALVFFVRRQQFLLNLHFYSISQLVDRLTDQRQRHHPWDTPEVQMTARGEAFTWSFFPDSELST